MKAIRIHETGEPEVMKLEELEKPVPQSGEVLIKVAAAGINYADLAQRQGAYLTRTRTPLTLGFEVSGTVEALGDHVTAPKVGTRVAAFSNGGYAEYVTAPAGAVIPIPDSLDFNSAAAFPVQGLTAYQLLHDSAHLQQGESVLVHAAAGGVGTLALQIARILGAKTIVGTASSERKLALVHQLGADAAVNYTDENWDEQVKAATNGNGPDIILEMVGGEIAEKSLGILAPYGRMIIYGAASGERQQFSGIQLMYKNQTVTGYWLTAWMSRTDKIAEATQALMTMLAQDKLQIIVGHTYPLENVIEAHTAIAQRQTTGKVVLTV